MLVVLGDSYFQKRLYDKEFEVLSFVVEIPTTIYCSHSCGKGFKTAFIVNMDGFMLSQCILCSL